MTPKNFQTHRPPAAKLNIAGLVVAAAGIMIQYGSGVDYPAIPPGPIILLAGAALVAFGRWHWSPVVGLGIAAPAGLVAARRGAGSRPAGDADRLRAAP